MEQELALIRQAYVAEGSSRSDSLDVVAGNWIDASGTIQSVEQQGSTEIYKVKLGGTGNYIKFSKTAGGAGITATFSRGEYFASTRDGVAYRLGQSLFTIIEAAKGENATVLVWTKAPGETAPHQG